MDAALNLKTEIEKRPKHVATGHLLRDPVEPGNPVHQHPEGGVIHIAELYKPTKAR